MQPWWPGWRSARRPPSTRTSSPLPVPIASPPLECSASGEQSCRQVGETGDNRGASCEEVEEWTQATATSRSQRTAVAREAGAERLLEVDHTETRGAARAAAFCFCSCAWSRLGLCRLLAKHFPGDADGGHRLGPAGVEGQVGDGFASDQSSGRRLVMLGLKTSGSKPARSPVSSASMVAISSGVRAKSNTSMFSAMRSG